MTPHEPRRADRGRRTGPGGAPIRLSLRSPADLLAAVPPLMGFLPAESLVLAAVVPDADGGPGRHLGAVLRADLPAPPDVPALVSACARRLAEGGPVEAALAVVGGGEPDADGTPPRADLVEEAVAVLAAARVPVPLRVWTPGIATGATWRCYPPCGCRGTVGPVEASPVAAASAWFGQVTYASRLELEASLAPDAGVDGARRRALVDRAADAAVLDRELAGPGAARRDLDALRRARAEVAAGGVLGDEEVARLAVALRDPHVRDACLGWALDGDGADGAGEAEQLWTTLVRAVPPPEVAEPAVLLAMTLLVRGGGALVGVALERARSADPDHRLTLLVESLLAGGVGRDEFRRVVLESGRAAAARLAA